MNPIAEHSKQQANVGTLPSQGARTMRKSILITLAASIATIGLIQPAHAVLDSFGPISPANGFPAWYMDRNGVALELCTNNNATVLAAGGCVITPADLPAGVPEVFPTNWFAEHFYTLASVVLNTAGLDAAGVPAAATGKVVLNMALEGSFASPTPVGGQQIAFNRWRVTHTNTACEGRYTYYTPNNAPQTFISTAGGKIFETSDIGVGTFAGPLAGTTGPFLQWSLTPGAAAKAPFVGPDGKRYISDYNAAGSAVTGSALLNPLRASAKAWIPADIKAMPFANYALVEGPGVATGNCAVTESVSSSTTFNLFGRYYDGIIASPSRVDRASFQATDTNNDGIPDTFQIGVWSTAQQKPAAALPAMAMSLLTGDPAAPSAVTVEAAMTRFQLGTSVTGVLPKFEYFGSTTAAKQATTATLAAQARPAADYARVRITTDVPAATLTVPLVDELNINSALWDSSLKTLTVVAESGAFLAAATPTSQTASNIDCSTPCLTIDALDLPVNDAGGVKIDYKMKSQTGAKYAIMSATIPNVMAPPPNVTVVSSSGGRDTKPVMYAGVPTGTALLLADTASTLMNVPVTVAVMLNDVGVLAVPGMQICTAATGGTCAVPVAATACVLNTVSPQCTAYGGRISISAANQVTYTPKAGVGSIAETFWYQVSTSSGLLRAPVTVSIGGVSGLPDARDDLGMTAVVSKAAPLNVLANDFVPAGIDMATLRLLDGPCFVATGTCYPSAATFDAQGRLVFTPPAVGAAAGAGAWTMHYTFNDVLGNVADPAVVTVNAVAAEVLIVGKAIFSVSKVVGILGNIIMDGTSSVGLGQIVELRLSNAATGPQGCNNPALGTKIAVASVSATRAWAFAATALQTQPATAYVYSPTFGGCTQVTVTLK